MDQFHFIALHRLIPGSSRRVYSGDEVIRLLFLYFRVFGYTALGLRV